MAKLASTSMLPVLFNNEPLSDIENKYIPNISHYWNHDLNHYPLHIIKKVVSSEIYENYYKFGFVRNPWSRAISAYKYTIQWYKNNEPQKLADEKFKTFKKWILKENPDGKYGEQYHFVKECNFIGKLENLQEDFNIVCDKIGIRHQKLPHKNKSNHKHYTEYYDNETREIVAEKYAKDIEYFGYKFGE